VLASSSVADPVAPFNPALWFAWPVPSSLDWRVC